MATYWRDITTGKNVKYDTGKPTSTNFVQISESQYNKESGIKSQPTPIPNPQVPIDKNGLPISTPSTPTPLPNPQIPTQTGQEYDPFDEALKYGYTREDFATDKGFYDYWKNKTPEQLKMGLQARSDFDAISGKKKVIVSPSQEELKKSKEADELKKKEEAEADIKKLPLAESNVKPIFASEKDGAFIQFSEDPDGSGPLNTNTLFFVDPITKTIRPISSPEAYEAAFEGKTLGELIKSGGITRISINSLQPNNTFGDYKFLESEYAYKPDGTFINPPDLKTDDTSSQDYDINKVRSSFYGKQPNEELSATGWLMSKGIMDIIEKDANFNISSDFINQIRNDKDLMMFYAYASAYGDYDAPDIMQDIKRRYLISTGKKDLENVKLISDTQISSQYKNSEEGKKAINNADLILPPTIKGLNIELFRNTLGNLPDEAFKAIVPPIDFTSPEWKKKLDEVNTAYYDILLKQLEATTDVQAKMAKEEFNMFKNKLNKELGINLSNDSLTAFKQIQDLSESGRQRGLQGSGLQQETIDKSLQMIRRSDELMRENVRTQEEEQERQRLLKYGTSNEINALTEEQKEKYGFKPASDVLAYFDINNLKKMFPNENPEFLQKMRDSFIDPNTNFYRSDLYKNMYSKKFELGEQKTDFQQQQVLATEEERLKREFLPYTSPGLGEEGKLPSELLQSKVKEIGVPSMATTSSFYKDITAGGKMIEVPQGQTAPSTNYVPISQNQYQKEGGIIKMPSTATPATQTPIIQNQDMTAFQEWTKGKNDILGKNWSGYKPIQAPEYDTEEKKKQWKNVQAVGGTLYGYK